jgi:6-pyruvoyltetrahydropterin/6-carboxytetrahydropterin synthase
MKAAVFRKAHFNAAHRLNNPNLSDEENKRLFGKCNLPNYHGHNYDLTVRVSGEIDPITGYVMDAKILSDLIKTEIEDRFDHKNLNLDTIEFRDLNPTAENIAMTIHHLLRAKIESQFEIQITLYETDRNFVQFPI